MREEGIHGIPDVKQARTSHPSTAPFPHNHTPGLCTSLWKQSARSSTST